MKDIDNMLNSLHTGICKCGNKIDPNSSYKMSGYCYKCSMKIDMDIEEEVMKKFGIYCNNGDNN
jgi:hypothetical protein